MAKSKARPFLTTDAETDPFKPGRVPAPFIWGLYDGEREDYDTFKTGAEMCDAVRDRRVNVYAHNGGKFDYHFIRDQINTDDPIMVIGGRLAQFKVGEAVFRDSMNILVNPLRAFAKDEIDYAKLEPDVRHLHMPEIRKYLRSDCVNLWNTIKAYFDRYGRTLTQAGASMRYWRENYEVPFIRQTLHQATRYRDYYYGGRVECFTSGYSRGRFSVVDKNSAYPDAMCRKHPISPESIVEDHLPPAGEMGPCLIRVEGISKGALPWRNEEDNNSLLFPDDERTVREYFITGWELEAALEFDAFKVFNVREVHRFPQVVDFAEYITNFYGERLDAKKRGDHMADIFAKLFMNSLYGKFAADPEKYAEYTIASDETLAHWCGACQPRYCGICKSGGANQEEYPYVRISSWGDRHLMSRPLPDFKHTFYNVATAASITGYVRAGLFRAMQQCSGVMYCDTDSIAARDVSRLPTGDALGEWKLEMVADEAAIAGKKLYAFRAAEDCGKLKAGDYKTASKGVRLEAADIIRVAKGETVRFKPHAPTFFLDKPPEFVEREIRMTYKKVAPETALA